ncbi:Putative ABC transporter permease protein (fragment) [uncultured Desulfatiglans sp.]|uniref:ABC transporter permease protein n=1 Tax=Uncultured Desulfatiglans sp. TaxID=1748965 RepID=A0A653AFV8_UNCDX
MKKPGLTFWSGLIGVTACLLLTSLFVGRYPMTPGDVCTAFFLWASDLWNQWVLGATAPSAPTIHHTVIFGIRLPRILAAALIGAGMSVAGTSFQGLFKNPLVSPEILGVASGAGFGAAIGILISAPPALVQGLAFLFGIGAVGMAYTMSRMIRSGPVLVLVLSGIIVGALFSALVGLLKYVADPYDTLPAIVFWLMGSLSSVSMTDVGMAAPPVAASCLVLFIIRWRMNLLTMSDDEAKALGVNTKWMTRIILICATLITASAVCISGIIGWIGLVVPHIGRMLVGPDFRKLLPASALIGAVFLLLVDSLSRTIFPTEIPLGILTAMIGAPVFAWLMMRRQVGWL